MTVLAAINLFIILVLVILFHTTPILNLPSGAPAGSCLSESPQHFAESRAPQTSPFLVRAFAKHDATGKLVVPVSIVPRGFGQVFKGYIVEARLAANPAVIVDGDFVPGEVAMSRAFSCGAGNRHANTMTHKNSVPKPRVSALWIPPEGFRDAVIFKATIVVNKETYWEDQISERVDLVGRVAQGPKLLPRPPMLPVMVPQVPSVALIPAEQSKEQELPAIGDLPNVEDLLSATLGLNEGFAELSPKGDEADQEQKTEESSKIKEDNKADTEEAPKQNSDPQTAADQVGVATEDGDSEEKPSAKAENESEESELDDDDDSY